MKSGDLAKFFTKILCVSYNRFLFYAKWQKNCQKARNICSSTLIKWCKTLEFFSGKIFAILWNFILEKIIFCNTLPVFGEILSKKENFYLKITKKHHNHLRYEKVLKTF